MEITNSKKKIIIGCAETAGIIHTLTEAYKELGHDVISISEKHKFYDFKYTVNPLDMYSFSSTKINENKIVILFFKLLRFLGRPFSLNERIKFLSFQNIINGADVYINVYRTYLLNEEKELKLLKKKGVKIITLFMGSDIRDYNAFKKKYNVKYWDFSEELNLPGTTEKLNKMLLHEKYSDAIFSVPDQSLFATKPYFHLQVPMQIKKFKFQIPQNQIPIIIHAPSKPEVKGTDLILKTLAELKDEGLKFELKLITNSPHSIIIEELAKADILVDEIILHGPGFLSFEAMLCGCAVATKYYEQSPNCFRPPVISINENNIKEQLKQLISDKLQIKTMAQKGYEYAIKNNDSLIIAKQILESIDSKKYNYFP